MAKLMESVSSICNQTLVFYHSGTKYFHFVKQAHFISILVISIKVIGRMESDREMERITTGCTNEEFLCCNVCRLPFNSVIHRPLSLRFSHLAIELYRLSAFQL